MAFVFGGLVVLVTGVLSFVLGSMLEQQSQRAEGMALSALTLNVSHVFAEGLRDRAREAQVLAESDHLWQDGMASARVRQAFARSQAVTPSNAWIGVADLKGTVLSSSGGILAGRDVSTRPWFRAGLNGLFVGDVHPAKLLADLLPRPASGEPLRFVDFAAPVHVDGELVGVVGIHGSWEWAHAAIAPLLPERASAMELGVFVFDRNGAMLHAPAGMMSLEKQAAQRLPLHPAAGGSAAPTVATWADGRDYLTSVTRVAARTPESDLGWYVVAREPVDIAFAPARSVARSTQVIGAIVAALAAALAWAAASRVARPLSGMARAAGAVERGEPGAVIPVHHGSTELNQLSAALSSMTARLLSANEALEKKVAERTVALAAANEELSRLALRDALTGLCNRRAFDEQLSRILATGRRQRTPVSLLMLDIDHFKRVNDRFGHALGDAVLRTLGTLLGGRFRATDVVARLGGEEFVVLMPGAALAEARQVAEALRAQIAATAVAGVGHVTASIGVAEYEPTVDDADRLMRRADEALYSAKGAGRNRVAAAAAGTEALAAVV